MAMTLVVTPTLVMTLVMTLAMTAPVIVATVAISRHVFLVVPVVPHEVDRPTAGVVLRAVFVPVFLVARWHVEVDRSG